MHRLLPLVLAACAGASEAPPATPADVADPPAVATPHPAPEADGVVVVPTSAGDVVITPVWHGTLYLTAGGHTVWFDPWTKGALASHPKADLLLVTDIHSDHLDPAGIDIVATDSTIMVAPKAVAEALEGRKVDHVLANGETTDQLGITIEATPMYNLVRGPEEGKLFHDKGRGNGYLLTYGGKRMYFAGDTECTPEMRALEGIDVAFLPMNLPYTMPPDEAAACAAAFAPARVVPYHYRDSDLSAFDAGLKDVAGVAVEHHDVYPAPAE